MNTLSDWSDEQHELKHLLGRLEALLRWPMNLLSVLWVVLFLVNWRWGLPPDLRLAMSWIWSAFLLYVLLLFVLAPSKALFLRSNALLLLTVLFPGLRLLNVLQALWMAQMSWRMNRVRTLRALNALLGRIEATLQYKGIGRVFGVSTLMALLGAGLMAVLESQQPGAPTTLSGWVYWVAMLFTSVGSSYSPVTGPGRTLEFLLALYGIGAFGYVTAALASQFVGGRANSTDAPRPATDPAPRSVSPANSTPD